MKSELTWEYLQSITAEPLPRLVAMSEEAWVEQWKSQVKVALESDLGGEELYEAWPESWPIPAKVWEERLIANWARLVEYDRLTAARADLLATAGRGEAVAS